MAHFFSWQDLDCWGNPEIIDRESLAILNSHQSRYPLGTDPWIQQTYLAIQQIDIHKHLLLTSIGMNTWEMITWLGGKVGIPMGVIIPFSQQDQPEERCRLLLKDFDLSPTRTVFIFLPCGSSQLKRFGPLRDDFVLTHADSVRPISIRPQGQIAGMMGGKLMENQIDRSAQIERDKGNEQPICHWILDGDRIHREVDPYFDHHVIHWTRTCAGPWPGEASAQFFEDVFSSTTEYARSARLTLRRIVKEQKIRASSWRIRDGQRVVSFSSLAPSEAISLMKWRARYVRYTFEPFGIAVTKEYAESHGIQPVKYLQKGEKPPSGEIGAFYQGLGSKTEWRQEQEYRYLGDFCLNQDPNNFWKEIDLSSYIQKE